MPRKHRSARNDLTASVTLLDLANDLDFWINEVRQYSMPGTGSIGTQKLHAKGIDGLESLAAVIRGYAEAGFRIDSGKEN